MRKKIHDLKSRVKDKFRTGSQTPPRSSTPATPHGKQLPSSSAGVLEWIKSEGWTNLEALLDTLSQAATVTGLGPVKTVIEGFAGCLGIYEEAAQGKKEYVELQKELEIMFGELKGYISSSPVITMSIESICGSISKELEYVKTQQDRPIGRRLQEAEADADNVLNCYRRIQGHMERLSRNANISTWIIVDEMANENRLRDLCTSSSACYNSDKANELKRRPCTEGTRTNVLTQMHSWMTGRETGNIYWMSGMAGTGKTTIAYSLCEELDNKANRMLCASFFCSRSLPECRDVGRIIPSIAYQLAQFSQPFRHALSQAIKKDPLAHTRLPQMQFQSLMVDPFSNAELRKALPKNMVVVIDALDECDDVKSTKQILDVLLTKSKDIPIKFVVSSRPEPAIRDQMEKNDTWVAARVVLHELDSGEVKTDIKRYLKAELAPVKPSESDIDRLAERAGVLFIYAATVVRYVGHDDFARGRARLRSVLGVSEQQTKAQTKEIDQLYVTILEAAVGDMDLEPTERDDIKLILHTVICAREPLTVATLSKLLQLGDVDRVQAAIRPLWSVLHVMGPNMTVTTLHASFSDYLLDAQRSGAWHFNAAAHHHLLARRCFECIRDTKLQFNICQLESSYLLDSEVADLDERVQKYISSEMRYSCQYWSSHLGVAESAAASDLMPLLTRLLTTHLLLWMEVRNLTNTLPATLGDLRVAKQWATRHDMSRDVIDLLSDAWRLASTFVFSPVSQSTPHLYVSMLPLLPSSSPVRKHYSARFGRVIAVEGTALDRRKNTLLAQWKFELYVMCMACSPDGTLVAVGGSSASFRGHDRLYLLDAFSGTMLLDLSQDHQTQVQSLAFLPDSNRLASGRRDGTISVWDVTTGQPLLSPFSAHRDSVSFILCSHNGSYIVSASDDMTIRIWDAVSGNPALSPLVGHINDVTCIAITSGDTHLVSGSWDGTIRVWDMQSGKTILDPIIVPGGVIRAIAFSPDDSHFVSGSNDGVIYAWDSQTGQMLLGPLRDQGGWVGSLSISPDGAMIASTSDIDGVRIWDATCGKMVSQLGPFSDKHGHRWATYSPDGTRIIFARSDGIIRLLDTQTAATADPLPGHTKRITTIDVSPNSRYVVSGSRDCTLCVWDLSRGTLLFSPPQKHSAEVMLVRFSPDGNRILSCTEDRIRQWDAQSGEELKMLMAISSVGIDGFVSAAYSQNGALIVCLTEGGKLSIWNSGNGQSVLGTIASPNQSNGLYADFSSNGATVIAGYKHRSICAWDVSTGQIVFSHQGHGESIVSSLAFSPDGLYCAQSYKGGEIKLKSLNTGEQLPGEFEGHTGDVNSVRFSSDGTQLVSGSDDTNVHVWDVETGQSFFGPLNGHTDRVVSVAFSPDGEFVVSASRDFAIRVWHVGPKAPSGQHRDTEYADWVLNEDGWVVSGESRLFWVPTDLRASLMSPRNTALMSRDGSWRLSFDSAMIGEKWTDCLCSH